MEPAPAPTPFHRRVLSFFRSTVVGGLFVVAPVVVLLVLVGQAIEVVYSGLKPVIGVLNLNSTASYVLAVVVAVAGVIAVCFAAGLLARTALTQNAVRWLESMILSNLPGYALMKGVGSNLLGTAGADVHPVVAVRFEASTMIGFQMDRLADGRLVVFIPNVPNAFAGTLHLLTPDRVTPLGLSMRAALELLGKLGIGAGAVLDG